MPHPRVCPGSNRLLWPECTRETLSGLRPPFRSPTFGCSPCCETLKGQLWSLSCFQRASHSEYRQGLGCELACASRLSRVLYPSLHAQARQARVPCRSGHSRLRGSRMHHEQFFGKSLNPASTQVWASAFLMSLKL